MTGDSSISNGVEKAEQCVVDQGAAHQNAGDQGAGDQGAVENGQANQDIVEQSIISRFDPKLFYRSDFYDEKADEEIFKQIEAQNEELCKEFNENRFTFSLKNMKTKKIPEFIEKFRASSFFLLCFQIKGRTKGSGKAAKTVFEQRVGPDYLKEIDAICIMLDDRHIYRFEGDEQIKQFREALARHGFEFEMERVVGICFDTKHAYKILKCCLEIDEATLRKIIWHDPKMAHWSLDPDAEEPASLMQITAEYLQLDDVEAFLANANEVMKNDPLKYSGLFRTVLLMPVMVEQRKLLKEQELFDSYINVELPALLLFGQMELTGFTFDVLLSRKSKKEWDSLINQLNQLIKDRNQEFVNVRSPQQVKAMLEKLGLYDQYVEHFPLAEGEVKENLKTGKEILEKMLTFDKLPGYILDIRKLYHTIGVVENLEKMCSQTNSVMGLYKHFISTGRVAMHDPNLLGIDNDQTIEINGEEHRVSLKRMFVAKAGFTLVAADYSQIELRILAVLADEAGLKEIFSQDQDPFKQIASRIKNKSVDEVTAEERSWSKQILYSIIYGAGVHRLSGNLGQSEEKTKEFLAEFHGVFKNIAPFIKRCIREAKQTGYAETLFGRKRILEAINNDEDDASRLSDERKCVNTRIQGTAADLVKLAMLKVNRAVAQEGIECDALLQVHDELIFQVRNNPESVRKFVGLLVRKMTGFGDNLGTKFAVKVKQGANWADLKEVDLNSL